jgi:ABC-type Mn2+/Zn2+ transport system ATPase subunit
VAVINIDSTARLEIQSVTISFRQTVALDDVTFSVPHGQRVAVVGPNGAGKSTLFKAIVGLLPVQKGQILIHGKPLGLHKDCVAYVPQRGEIDWRFPVTVRDVVTMGRFGYTGWIRKENSRDRAVVDGCLDQLGMLKYANRTISELSGGQQQRVFLARALAQEPHVLIMDEPFNGIDISTSEILFDLFEQLKEKQVTLLVSTHDLNMAAQRFDQILLLKRRLIAYGAAEQVFTSSAIQDAFGDQVLYVNGTAVVDHCCPGDDQREGDGLE